MTIHIMLDLETWGTTPGSDLRSIGACVFDPVLGWNGAACPTFYVATDNPGENRDEATYETADGHVVHNALYPHYDGTTDMFRRYNLTRDPQTVKWWNDQSAEAQAAFADPVDLREALGRFGDWLHNLEIHAEDYGDEHWSPSSNLRIWSHGSAFDPPILATAYTACSLPVPWHYRSPRDTRTIFDAAGIEDHSAWLAQHPGPLGLPHHALDDAICQARAVCAAMARITIAN